MMNNAMNKTGSSNEAAEQVAPPKASGEVAAVTDKPAMDGEHMRQAVDIMAKHDKLMEEQPELHNMAKAHVKKHGHAKAMAALPRPKIKSISDLKSAAKNMIGSGSSDGSSTDGDGY